MQTQRQICNNNQIQIWENAGVNMIEWKNNQANALYLDRFGVNVNYLCLFVVDINSPAIELYQKLGFIRAEAGFKNQQT